MSSPELRVNAVPATPPDLWRGLTALSAALLTLMLLWAVSGETRLVSGAPVWAKPAKFALSFVVLFATIALVADRLSPSVRDGRPLHLIGLGMGVAMIAEMGWMIHQAARGTGSHFNFATPFETFMYTAVMGGGAVYLVLAIGVIGWIVRGDRDAALGPALREGVWLGFLASFALTLVIAGYMSSGTASHVGVHPEGAATVPLVGWSGVTGDLRPAHFLALHAMQVLPLLALWLERRRSDGIRTVRLAALGWITLTLAIFVQALAGLPLVPLG